MKKNGYFLLHSLVLARSLRRVNSSYPLIVLIPDQEDCGLLLEYQGRVIKDLNMAFLRVPPALFRPEALPKPLEHRWRFTYPKSYVWAMDSFERLVYLDGDVMVLHNSDDLFDLPDPRRLRMSTNQRACDKLPFEANVLGAASNLMVLAPHLHDFYPMLEEFRLARGRGLWQEGSADDQSIIERHFREQGRLERLPPADMLYTECLRLYNCQVKSVRALHFGNLGRLILDQGVPLLLELDHTWKPVFHRWAASCHTRAVMEACNGHCQNLCLPRNTDWDCKHC